MNFLICYVEMGMSTNQEFFMNEIINIEPQEWLLQELKDGRKVVLIYGNSLPLTQAERLKEVLND